MEQEEPQKNRASEAPQKRGRDEHEVFEILLGPSGRPAHTAPSRTMR